VCKSEAEKKLYKDSSKEEQLAWLRSKAKESLGEVIESEFELESYDGE